MDIESVWDRNSNFLFITQIYIQAISQWTTTLTASSTKTAAVQQIFFHLFNKKAATCFGHNLTIVIPQVYSY
jgi:hypothetical protein